MQSAVTAPRSPRFLITIDTEGDNLWARPRVITTRNARFLPRFQALCERFGLRPTYLVNYEMATSAEFVAFGRDALHRGVAEIGMHLHAWNTPPLRPLTVDDHTHHPYLAEYPAEAMTTKIATMTTLLTETFGRRMVSHRAGRWYLDETYARLLVEFGYRVDCSVTPGVSWRHHRGDPAGHGGADYTEFPNHAYAVDLARIARPGRSPLVEIPMTIVPVRSWISGTLRAATRPIPIARRALERVSPTVRWLRPNGRNGQSLITVVQEAVAAQQSYVQFMLHSSELMPGGHPRLPDATSVDRLYRDVERLFALAREKCVPSTLAEYGEPMSRDAGDTNTSLSL